MSQAKVDRYKASKKNRKKEIKKAKRNKILARVIGALAAIAIVCWIGFSGYSYYQEQKPMTQTEINTDAISDYLNNLSSSLDESDS